MFTGIIEETGKIVSCGGGKLTVQAKKVLEGTKVGDSIAVNGVCLTVTSMSGGDAAAGGSGATAGSFTADVMNETLSRTNLGSLKKGSPVNLERAMAADGRFGGHIVSGHVDGTGRIQKMQKDGNAVWVYIECSASVLALIIEKGSITIDGISLTVAKLSDAGWFAVSVIPHTGEETTLLSKKAGDIVNLENDIVGKYVKRLLQCGELTQSARDEKLLNWLSS